MVENRGPASGRGWIKVLALAVGVSILAITVAVLGFAVFDAWRTDVIAVLTGLWALTAAGLFALVPVFRREDRELHRDVHPVQPIDPLHITERRPWSVAALASSLAFRLEDTPYLVRADHQSIVVTGGPVTFELQGFGRRLTRAFRLTLLAGREAEFEQICHDHVRERVPGRTHFTITRSGSPPGALVGQSEVGDLVSTRHVQGPLRHAMDDAGWRITPRPRVLSWIYPAVGAGFLVIASVPFVLGVVLNRY